MRRWILPIAVATTLAPSHLAAQRPDFAPALPRDGATLTFSNDLVDAWDVTWAVDTPTPMHRHDRDYFGVELTPSQTRLTAPDGGERVVSFERGRLWFLRAGVTHAETGLTDDPPRHAIIVELKGTAPAAVPAPSDLPTGPVNDAIEPAIDNEQARIWDVTLPTVEPASLRFYDRPVVLMFMDDTELAWAEAGASGGRRSFGAGQVLFLTPGTSRAVWSIDAPARVIVAELQG